MADVSVRPARGADGGALARAQVDGWLDSCAALLPPDVVDRLAGDLPAQADEWRLSATSPPSPRHRVLVACEGPEVVGGAAVGPAEDDDLDPTTDAELLALYVAPARR